MQITGLVSAPLLFDEVLENVFADEVSGVDCVIETETEAITYTVVGVKAQLVYVKGKPANRRTA
jgi:hypothetical protein